MPKKSSSAEVVLGRERLAKVSALERIALTPAMKKRAKEFDRLGLTDAERRREIFKIHRTRLSLSLPEQ
jgi:hypothetical protein